MPNYRNTTRTNRAIASARAREIGINVDDVRRESRSTIATDAMITRMANESTPTQGHERLSFDDFAGQTFDGTNTSFTISKLVLGENIQLWRIDQASGSLIRLAKTSNPAPSGNQFWFDGFFTVRVGTAPQLLDGLLAAYVSVL
jgi:hypothetical protein